MSLIYPAAKWRPVVNHGAAMKGPILGVCVHETEGGASDPFAWFNEAQSEASSTWFIDLKGNVEQYVDALVRAWAQAAGNDTYQSIEFAGLATTPMTEAQLEAGAKLIAWGHKQPQLAWALSSIHTVGQKGVIYHAAGGASWGGHPCPGPIRIAQIPKMVQMAAAIVNPPAPKPVPKPAPVSPADTYAKIHGMVQIDRQEALLAHKAHPHLAWYSWNGKTMQGHSEITDIPTDRIIYGFVSVLDKAGIPHAGA